MSVNPIFLIGAAGAAAYLVTSKKKSSGKSSTSGNGKTNGNGNGNVSVPEIVSSGEREGFHWRVRKAVTLKGFADRYYGEWKPPSKYALWSKAHDDAVNTPGEAELLAKEKIVEVIAKSRENIPYMGTTNGIPWRVVREVMAAPGGPPGAEANVFFGEYRLPTGPVDNWERVTQPAATAQEAKALLAGAIEELLAAQAGGDVQG